MHRRDEHTDARRAKRHGEVDRHWRDALQHAMDSMLPDRVDEVLSRPRPTILSVSDNGLWFEMEMRFLKGREYCCAESGCFVGAFTMEWWRVFRAELQKVTDRDPPPMSFVILGVVEEGARLRYLGDGIVGVPSVAYTYKSGPWREIDAKSFPR